MYKNVRPSGQTLAGQIWPPFLGWALATRNFVWPHLTPKIMAIIRLILATLILHNNLSEGKKRIADEEMLAEYRRVMPHAVFEQFSAIYLDKNVKAMVLENFNNFYLNYSKNCAEKT